MTQEIEVTVTDPSQQAPTTHVGLEICKGPGVMRLLLTRPYRSAGQTVDIPVEQVEAVALVASAPLGEPPKWRRQLRVPGREPRGDR